jgi:hypothetical protein
LSWREYLRKDHHDAVLAEILLSEKVGVLHIRHVGDIISARAQLSMGMLNCPSITLEKRADIAEVILRLEDAYRDAWESLLEETDPEEKSSRLGILEKSLQNAASGIVAISLQYGIENDSI